MNKLTPDQLDALDKAESILREHFESSVIVVNALIDREPNDRTPGRFDYSEITWHGGFIMCVGLLVSGLFKMFFSKSNQIPGSGLL